MVKKIVFKLSGMDCAACVINVDGELEETKGIASARTNYAKSQLEVTFDPKAISEKQIITIISKIGYTAVAL